MLSADRVREASTSTGTGAFTLGGAPTGFQTFAAAFGAAALLVPYAIVAVNGSGQPTGDWEVGLGTLSGSTTLDRTNVLASSAGGSAVAFAAGSKDVFVTIPAATIAGLARQVALDFGPDPVGSKSFTITTPAVPGQNVIMTAAADVNGDDLEMDGFVCAARVTAANTVEAFIISVTGPVAGTYRFNLIIG